MRRDEGWRLGRKVYHQLLNNAFRFFEGRTSARRALLSHLLSRREHGQIFFQAVLTKVNTSFSSPISCSSSMSTTSDVSRL